jgi:hypothetical protein
MSSSQPAKNRRSFGLSLEIEQSVNALLVDTHRWPIV